MMIMVHFDRAVSSDHGWTMKPECGAKFNAHPGVGMASSDWAKVTCGRCLRCKARRDRLTKVNP